MRAFLTLAGLFALACAGCSGSGGEQLFAPGAGSRNTQETGGAPGGGGGQVTGSGGDIDSAAGGGTGGASGTNAGGNAGGSSNTGGSAGGPTAGAGGTVPARDAGVTVDATRPVIDATPVVDAAPETGAGDGIQCGSESCIVGNQQCCLANQGAMCTAIAGGGCPVNSPRLRCDSASDCPNQQICCASPAGNGAAAGQARCLGANNCANQQNSQVLCDPANPVGCMQGELCSPTLVAIFPNRPFCHAP